MKRRKLFTLLGAAAAWPLAARAQQGERKRHIGVLHNFAADDPLGQARNGVFLQGLQQAGWTIGRNVQIETRWAAGTAPTTRSGEVMSRAGSPHAIAGRPHTRGEQVEKIMRAGRRAIRIRHGRGATTTSASAISTTSAVSLRQACRQVLYLGHHRGVFSVLQGLAAV